MRCRVITRRNKQCVHEAKYGQEYCTLHLQLFEREVVVSER